MKKIITYIKFSLFSFILFVGAIVANHHYVSYNCNNRLYNSIDNIPHNKTGLLLGTSKKLSNSRINFYYKYRIDAAIALFKAGKIDNIIVSGDNGTIYYDETTTMQKDLILAGIPESKIFLDYAGFRTLDSVVRSKAIFGQESITIISQMFHNERAVYIAENKNIDAIGFNAKNVNANAGFKTNLREYFARVKMQLDLLFGTAPKFLGEKIKIP